MTDTLDPTARHDERRDAFAGRIGRDPAARWSSRPSTSAIGWASTWPCATAGPATAADLAARAGIDARYALEWLEQQAIAGVLDVDDVAAPADERRFSAAGRATPRSCSIRKARTCWGP